MHKNVVFALLTKILLICFTNVSAFQSSFDFSTSGCTCNGRTFLVFFSNLDDIIGSMFAIKDIDQCRERNRRHVEILQGLKTQFPDDVISSLDPSGVLLLSFKADGQLLVELEKASPSPKAIVRNTLELYPELVTFEEIDINDDLVTSQAGINREDIVDRLDTARATIVRLNIPDRCL